MGEQKTNERLEAFLAMKAELQQKLENNLIYKQIKALEILIEAEKNK